MEPVVKFIIRCGNTDPDLFSADLFDLGCTGIHETGAGEIEAFFPPVDMTVKTVTAYLAEKGLLSRMIYVEKRDWNKIWREKIRPVRLTPSFTVYPDWIRPDTESSGSIIISPKTAFGTGHHESTRLCAVLLERHANPGLTLLDVGSGSGILAILGEKLGMTGIVALDNDPAAGNCLAENSAANGCRGIACFTGTLEALRPGSVFDLVTANIISSVIYGMMPRLLELARGKMIFSGILMSEKNIFIDRLSSFRLALVETASENEWFGAVFEKV